MCESNDRVRETGPDIYENLQQDFTNGKEEKGKHDIERYI